MGLYAGWYAKYWFFSYGTWHWGYNTSWRSPNFTNYTFDINFTHDWAFMRQGWSKHIWFPSNRFAAEWTGKIKVDTSGTYTFSTASDDGSRLYINNEMIVNNWGLHGRRYRTGNKLLTTGWYDCKVTFFENYGAANNVVKYKGPDTSNAEVLLKGYH